ncbi:hypothetical protein HED60_21375 [Planctomycetales bacterium ZRK34]|nr:hypothetical protein HED60_21375 [Planctomycetales bacterium ZRK34]
MARNGVTLGTSKAKGKRYWQLRWFDPTTGKRRSENIGRVGKVSKRAAETLRSRKQVDLENKPGLRAGNATPTIEQWCDTLIAEKESEAKSPATIKLYKLVKRLLVGYFGNRGC